MRVAGAAGPSRSLQRFTLRGGFIKIFRERGPNVCHPGPAGMDVQPHAREWAAFCEPIHYDMCVRDSQSWGMPLDCLQMVSDIVDRAVKRHRWSAARIGMVKRLLHVSGAVYQVICFCKRVVCHNQPELAWLGPALAPTSSMTPWYACSGSGSDALICFDCEHGTLAGAAGGAL